MESAVVRPAITRLEAESGASAATATRSLWGVAWGGGGVHLVSARIMQVVLGKVLNHKCCTRDRLVYIPKLKLKLKAEKEPT